MGFRRRINVRVLIVIGVTNCDERSEEQGEEQSEGERC